MTFELRHASVRAFLVPNHTRVSVRIRGESEIMENWDYRGFDDDQTFILITREDRLRWIPINSIAYIEQVDQAS